MSIPYRPIPGETITLGGMRAVIAGRMVESLRTAAQLTLHREADARPMVAARDELRRREGLADIGYNDLLLVAVTRTLATHPQLNATTDGKTIQRWSSINVGMAVALDEGLIAPVIKECQTKSLAEIAAEAKELAARARAGRLGMPDVLDGTFTVTNLGGVGVDYFTPIINPPQVAILGVGRIRSTGTLALSLTIDHRALDGVPGGLFLADLASALEAPLDLQLERPAAQAAGARP